NPVDFATFDSLVVPPGTSAAEQIAAAAPGARVVKAFNTTFAGTLVAGQAGGAPLDVFIAGDDAEAKQPVADVAVAGGLRPSEAPRASRGAGWFSRTEPLPSKTCQPEEPEVRDRRVAAPAASRWNSVRMVVSASPPLAGLVYRTAAWPGSSTPGRPSPSSSSWA